MAKPACYPEQTVGDKQHNHVVLYLGVDVVQYFDRGALGAQSSADGAHQFVPEEIAGLKRKEHQPRGQE